MARGRRRRSRATFVAVLLCVAIAAAYYGWASREGRWARPSAGKSLVATIGDAASSQSTGPGVLSLGGGDEPRSQPAGGPGGVSGRDPAGRGGATSAANAAAMLTDGRAAMARGDLVAARTSLSAALLAGLPPDQRTAVRDELLRLAEETILSPRVVPSDPLVDTYTVRPGDSLARIAQGYRVTPELLARINSLPDMNRIRDGQRIKVVKGPFRVEVIKSAFQLEVFLQDTLVKVFPVGLGADGSTPVGQWRVATKLKNPTYFPPRGGQIIAADDPQNPLGERWIGLEGIAGEAVGQDRYGIHGTFEPDSVGKAVSMGCIRLRNPDVDELFDWLVTGQSEVLVRP